jgi:NAD(P)-dependent dehydrogenase (short-subunit alcohol dehydrogenase family)
MWLCPAQNLTYVLALQAHCVATTSCRKKYPGSKVEVGPPLDLKSQDSVKKFAAAINKRAGQLNILVNNAGLGYTPKSFTEQGVGMLTQVGAVESKQQLCCSSSSVGWQEPAEAC